MFFSEQYKVHWWGPPRIASRALSGIPKALNFTNNEDGHSLTIINPEWEVILPVRNPYSRAVSWWNLRFNGRQRDGDISFEDFIKSPNNEYFNITPGRAWEPISTIEKNNLKVKKLIRYEFLVQDLMEIDFIQDNFDKVSQELFYLKYDARKEYRKEYVERTNFPVHHFYNQELADIVWENRQFEFKEWGYEKDSWKYLL